MRLGTCLILTLASFASAQTAIHGKDGIELPPAPLVEKHPVTDTYQIVNGQQVTVTDNFRYLEDAKAPATRAYIATQNAYTQSYLDQVKILPDVRTQMAALLRVDQMNVPTRRGDKFFFSRATRAGEPEFDLHADRVARRR